MNTKRESPFLTKGALGAAGSSGASPSTLHFYPASIADRPSPMNPANPATIKATHSLEASNSVGLSAADSLPVREQAQSKLVSPGGRLCYG